MVVSSTATGWVHTLDIPYSPALLLEGRFDTSIMNHPEYVRACQEGFESFFDDLCTYDENLQYEVVCLRQFSLSEVTSTFLNDFTQKADALARCSGSVKQSEGWTIGFYVGWLSALALSQPTEAQAGMSVLAGIVTSELGKDLCRVLRSCSLQQV